MILNEDFKEFIGLLNYHKVEYLLVGGYAVAIYGYPRFTGDIDFWISINEDNAKKIINVLRDFGFSSLKLKYKDFLSPNLVFQFGIEPNRIDLMTSISGVEFKECYEKRNLVAFEELIIPVIDLESLKINKKSIGRSKDDNDFEKLS